MFFLILLPALAETQTLYMHIRDKKLVGKDLVPSNHPVVETNLFIPIADGFYIDFWLSEGLRRDAKRCVAEELDYIAGWSGEKFDLIFDAGIGYFNLCRLDRMSGDIIQPYFEIGKRYRLSEDHTITPYLRSEILIPIKWAVEAKTGALISSGIKHQWQLAERLTLEQKISFAYDTGSMVRSDHGFLADYNAVLGWKITDKITLDLPTFRALTPLQELKDGRKLNTVFGAGIRIKF